MKYTYVPKITTAFASDAQHMRVRKGEVQGETKGINQNGVFVADCLIFVTLFV